jgi:AraC-like DNA-binding protein
MTIYLILPADRLQTFSRWRMLLAGRSLSRGEPVGAIARSLGYESESAFSTAFKHVMGSRPGHHARLTGLA